jgi:hypothetical protein
LGLEFWKMEKKSDFLNQLMMLSVYKVILLWQD